MKQTMKYLSMAALVVMGAIVASCAKEEPAQPEEITPEVVEPVAEDNIVVCTTTVSFDNSADADETKALAADGVKTFATGEMIAVIYKNDSDQTVKAVSAELTAGDITNGGKSATFSVTLINPGTDAAVRIIYPAAMAASTVATNVAVDADATINYAALNTQDGTLATLSSNLDLAVYDGALNGTSLPADPALKNKLAICEYTIKDNAEPTNDLTSSITGMTISDGTYNYSVTRSAAAGPIYVAIRPTSGATINYTATDGTNHYKKTVTDKSYAASHMYPLGLRMAASNIIDLSTLTDDYVAQHGDVLINTLGENHKISIAAGATVTLDNVSINADGNWNEDAWAGLTCLGDATIILSGTNTVKGFNADYPGIQAAHNDTGVGDEYTLTIQGTGSLTASSNGWGAGIGGGWGINCGNIVINGGSSIEATGGNYAAGIGGGSWGGCGDITISGGNITANGGGNGAGIGTGFGGTCGNITISGGSITANGGEEYAAGIGTGFNGNCGSITIYNTVTSVRASKGTDATNSIGTGYGESCGTVKFGDQTMYDGSSWTTTPTDGGIYGGLSLAITTTTNTNDTWTLTPYVAPAVPTGAIDGLFSVSSTKQVYFSQGNLQATCASADADGSTQETWTWQFASNQYEVGTANSAINGNGSVSTAGTVDLFCWSTDATYYGISTITDNTGLQGAFVDWGGNIGSGWYTLSKEEWDYLFSGRTNAASKYGHGSVNGVNGMIILPDSWTLPDGLSFTSGISSWTNSYTTVQWSQMESAGAVFLPAAGIHIDTDVYAVGSTGLYWSSSVYEDNKVYAFRLSFDESSLFSSEEDKSQGCSVRLVKDAN